MKSLLNTPSSESPIEALADHMEVRALNEADGNISKRDMISALHRLGNENEDTLEGKVDSVLIEIGKRIEHLGKMAVHYPFCLDHDLLKIKDPIQPGNLHYLYLFMLLATRLNMNVSKKQTGSTGGTIDATTLFEQISLAAAKRYFGGNTDNRVEGFIAGTARFLENPSQNAKKAKRGFEAAINDLCGKWGEGTCFRSKDPGKLDAKDDRLDIVVWRKFSDKRGGKVTAFGQCKTGSNWEEELPRTQPDSFCRKWLHDQPSVTPIRFFFLTDRVFDKWYGRCADGGVIFDRCRIMDYSDEIPSELMEKCVQWTKAALRSQNLRHFA